MTQSGENSQKTLLHVSFVVKIHKAGAFSGVLKPRYAFYKPCFSSLPLASLGIRQHCLTRHLSDPVAVFKKYAELAHSGKEIISSFVKCIQNQKYPANSE